MVLRTLPAVPGSFTSQAMTESLYREAVQRLLAVLAERDWSGEFGTHRFADHDIQLLFELIRRYGGRKNWTPTEDNIATLPGPVRRHILRQRAEIERLQREAIKA